MFYGMGSHFINVLFNAEITVANDCLTNVPDSSDTFAARSYSECKFPGQLLELSRHVSVW